MAGSTTNMRPDAGETGAPLPLFSPALQEKLWYYGKRLSGFLLRGGMIWAILSILGLFAASYAPWMAVPLIQVYRGWDIPINLGWGGVIPAINYGSVSLALGLIFLVRAALVPWKPLRRGSFVAMGVASFGVFGLFLFQFLFVDFQFVYQLWERESRYLVINNLLGYSMPAQYFAWNPFTFDMSGVGDRWNLFRQLINPGTLLPLVAALLCFFGAVFAPTKAALPQRALIHYPRFIERHRTAWRRGLVGVAIVLGALILARPIVAVRLYFDAQSAIKAGNYQPALVNLKRARQLLPTLDALPDFHQYRGEALYQLGQTQNLDSGLYLAAQYRNSTSLQQALQEDDMLYQRFPNSTLVRQDLALTLEMLANLYTSVKLLVPDNEALATQPQLAATIQIPATALPWLNQLLQIEPDNVYGYYLRGRILFSQQAYENSANDFAQVVNLSHDKEMKSTAYTYWAFCDVGRNNIQGARDLLFTAEKLDDGYFNTTAREALSGLH